MQLWLKLAFLSVLLAIGFRALSVLSAFSRLPPVGMVPDMQCVVFTHAPRSMCAGQNLCAQL